MPGTMPATSQLDWLISITAMIVLFWSRATRDLLKSFGWGIAALHRLHAATKLPSLAARPIASIGPSRRASLSPRHKRGGMPVGHLGMTASLAQKTRFELRGAWQRLRPFPARELDRGLPRKSAREKAAQPG